MMNEKKIWNYLKQHSRWTEEGIAGLMGNLRAESGFKPNNMENAYEKRLGFTDETYTAAVDNGSYTRFDSDGCGYGLAQWSYGGRKRRLLEFARASGKSIGDAELQCDFMIREMEEYFPEVDKVLRTAKDVYTASNKVLKEYENPAVQTVAVQNVRHGYGITVYNNNHGTVPESAAAKKLRDVIDALEELALTL